MSATINKRDYNHYETALENLLAAADRLRIEMGDAPNQGPTADELTYISGILAGAAGAVRSAQRALWEGVEIKQS